MTKRVVSAVCVLFLLSLASCATSKPGKPGGKAFKGMPTRAAQEPATLPPPPPVTVLSGERVDYYKKAIPEGVRFVEKKIPKELIRSANKGNDTFVVAQDSSGRAIGYLRDLLVPVTTSGACACDPINATLVFAADYSLRTITAPAPLLKHGHRAMTDAEMKRLIELAKDPPEKLTKIRFTEDVVDATTAATKTDLQEVTIPGAALSTHRLVTLVRDTQRTLQGAQLTWDHKRLRQIVDANTSDAERARVFAGFLGDAETPEVRQQAYRLMVHHFVLATKAQAKVVPEVETRLLKPDLAADVDDAELVRACYQVATLVERRALAERCLLDLKKKNGGGGAGRAALARLEGTLKYFAGDKKVAASLLGKAAVTITHLADPQMHLRLADALHALGNDRKSCTVARKIFWDHPLLPGARAALGACKPQGGKVATLIADIQREQKSALLKRKRVSGDPAPTLPLEDDRLRQLDLTLAAPGKVSVLVIFSTWCKHCNVELPQVVGFHQQISVDSELRDRVRVIGVRTAIERETVPYEQWRQWLGAQFPIYNDATMSLAFARIAKFLDVPTVLPSLYILDERGVVRYILESGDYRDTQRELQWTVQSLVREQS